MAIYFIDPNAKSKAEEKIIYQLGSPEMIEVYTSSKNVLKKYAPLIIISAIAGFSLGLIGVAFINSTILGIIGIAIFIISVIAAFGVECSSNDKFIDAWKLSPDLKEIFKSEKNEQIEINEYGISHTFLFEKGDDDPSIYYKRIIEKENIREIFRCEALGAYIFCGDMKTYKAYGNVLKNDPAKVTWSENRTDGHLSLRVYDYWINESSGFQDMRKVINTSFGIPIKEISREEAMSIISRDDNLKINGSKNLLPEEYPEKGHDF